MTLIETMVSLAIGMIVVAGILSIYVSTVQSSGETLENAKLNQEIMALLSVMSNDIRRAGYNAGFDPNQPNLNAFAQSGTTALTVFRSMGGVAQGSTGNGSCILYAYDSPQTVAANNTLAAGDVFGFRLNNNVVEMRQSGATNNIVDFCNDAADSWMPLTDGNVVRVTALDFDLANSRCVRTDEPNDTDDDGDGDLDNIEEYDCYTNVPAVGSLISTAETREVAISVTAELTNDDQVTLTLTDTVRVRNDLIRIR